MFLHILKSLGIALFSYLGVVIVLSGILHLQQMKLDAEESMIILILAGIISLIVFLLVL